MKIELMLLKSVILKELTSKTRCDRMVNERKVIEMKFNVNTELYISEDTFKWMAYYIKKEGWTVERAIEEAFENEMEDLVLARIITEDIREELIENYLDKYFWF